MEDYRINTTKDEISRVMAELKYKDAEDTMHKLITFLRHLENHKDREDRSGCESLLDLQSQGYISRELLTQLMPVIKDPKMKYEITLSSQD